MIDVWKGIAYQDVDKLWPVVLDEIPPARWGEQVCLMCVENKNIFHYSYIRFPILDMFVVRRYTLLANRYLYSM